MAYINGNEIWFSANVNITGGGGATSQYERVDSVEEMADTSKRYVLNSTGTLWAYGETNIDDTNRNLYDASACAINVNPDGTARPGAFVTDYILVDIDYISPYNVRIVELSETNSDLPDLYKIAYYNASKNVLGTEYANTIVKTKNGDRDYSYQIGYKSDGSGKLAYHDSIAYVKLLCRVVIGDNITQAQVPTNITVTTPEPKITTGISWYDTGLSPDEAGSDGGVYAELIAKVNNNSADIAELADRVTVIENKSGMEFVPSYWQASVDTAVSKVKGLQNIGGRNIVNFVWFSDFHYDGATRDHVGNVGHLCSYMMDSCNIPLALMNGDTLTQGVFATDTQVLNALDGAMALLSPIGADRLMLVRGNHDDVYGESGGVSYVNKVAPSKIWNKLHRPQAKDFRRVFGGDGTYFYLDNVPQKVRFICLNSHYYDGEAITSGTSKAMTTSFGTAQLEWLENTALTVDSDWSVVVALHAPPFADFADQFSSTEYENFRSIITAAATNIIAIFCGHAHKDRIITNSLPCPICTITCAINVPYDGTASERVTGTDKETALDIVSIDKANRKIYMTRLGAGVDREINY